MASTLPTLDHLKRPELLARVEQLTENRRTLAGAPRQLISLLGQALRAIGIVILLATVYLPLLVVPALEIAPALADRRAGRVLQRSQDDLAEDRRMLEDLLAAMYRPIEGRVLIDGLDLASFEVGEWRSRITATFQDFARFQLPLRESVGIGDLPRAGEAAVVRGALERAGSGALEGELAAGLETRVGTRYTGGHELSGGQWQRLALARGLMREGPLLVVLDEPTASLDAPTEAALFTRYAAAAREAAAAHGTITLLVSHRFSTVRAADLIVVLEDGRVREVGSHPALIAAGGTYAELFELQARAYV